ncbi:PLP-dependent aminotransferase family protein [Microbacterium dauci]|uniref:PLP-dependent aminotransferase family protein n=1 Tax=Microbacterium dauci TaxID=3048008 RepID=A0ABT6ZBZ0_9MICO|nr:PLP-dependent aminotransferase family protein [Microbacterium sp. LX3-4]MDJ1113677.1 PLP-dependent aminotransferase family protein [Microbacterium sp. LX3-4]
MDSRISARSLTIALGGWRTRTPTYEALADGIRLLCLDDRLAAHTALPAERDLAGTLGVSRTTVAAAYRSLRASGHIDSVRGSGSVTLPQTRRGAGRAFDAGSGIDLQQASPAAWPGLAGVIAETAADAASLVARPGYDILGSPSLRAAIATRYTVIGIPTTPDEILVTNGGQHAIHLVTAALLHRGDTALLETPTYPHAAEAFRSAGARLTGIPVNTTTGWDLDRAEQAFRRAAPSMAYLMPWFQNPTGRVMTASDAATIRAAAARAGTTLVVDETTAELAIDAHAPLALDFGPAAVRIGSLGKTVWGGLRIGWVRAQPTLIRRLVGVRPHRDLGTPEFEQAVAARLLPRMPEILRQRARLLGAGRDALTDALARRLPEWHVPRVDGGVSLWVELDAPLSGALVMAAQGRGVHLSAGARFALHGGHDSHLRVPFTATPGQLRDAVDVLADVWPAVRRGAPAVSTDALAAIV